MNARKRTAKPPPKENRFLTLITAGVFLLGAAIIIPLANAADRALDDGTLSAVPGTAAYPAPALALIDLDGNPVALSDYLGLVVLVNNWASWCPPCQAEMPDLQSYYAEHAGEGFVIAAINAGEPEETVRAFVSRYGLTFPVWLDPGMSALNVFQNPDLPSSYVIDRTGTVRLRWTGRIGRDMLERDVTPLIRRSR